MKNFGKKILISTSDIQQKTFAFFRTCWAGLSVQSMCPSDFFWRNICFRKKWFFVTFGNLRKKFQPSAESSTAWLYILFFSCPWEKFVNSSSPEKCFLIFAEHWPKSLQVLFKPFWRGCQNCVLRVNRIICSWKMCYSISFGAWARKLQASSKNFQAGCSELLFRCQKKNFGN